MITTGQVFVLAMQLMDEQSQDGTDNGYPEEYEKKSWPILSVLQAELLSNDVTPPIYTTKDETMLLDDRIAITALSYGLAAHLLLTEDQGRSSFFNARYDELKRRIPTTTVIEESYSLDGGGY